MGERRKHKRILGRGRVEVELGCHAYRSNLHGYANNGNNNSIIKHRRKKEKKDDLLFSLV